MNLTVAQIQSYFTCRIYTQRRYSVVVPNAELMGWSECDLLAIRKSGFVDEIEIKLTASDFKADFKKTIPVFYYDGYSRLKMVRENKHELLEAGRSTPNYFTFMMPHDLMDTVDIPDYAGLYTVTNSGRVIHLKEPKRLHSAKMSMEKRFEIARKLHFRYWKLA